jgi:hypothetical protein
MVIKFSPTNLISLDDYVFNTEAHPLRIPKSSPSPEDVRILWTGPETSSFPIHSIADTAGEGTISQLRNRIHQAAALAIRFYTTEFVAWEVEEEVKLEALKAKSDPRSANKGANQQVQEGLDLVKKMKKKVGEGGERYEESGMSPRN